MKIKDLTKEELENLSYDDLAFMLLEESKKKMKIIDLFNKIGKLINLSEREIEDKIADFFEMLTLDKRFIMLDDGAWDLRVRHAGNNIVIEEDEDEITLDEIDETEDVLEEEEDIFYDEDDTDDTEDDLKDLVVIDEEEDSL